MKNFKQIAAFLLTATMLASFVPTGFAAWTSETGDFGVHNDVVQWYDFNTYELGQISNEFIKTTKSDYTGSPADEAPVVIKEEGEEKVLSLQAFDSSLAPGDEYNRYPAGENKWDGDGRKSAWELYFDNSVDFSKGSVTVQFTMKRNDARTNVMLLGENKDGTIKTSNLVYNYGYGDGIRLASGNDDVRISYEDARDYYYDYKFVIGDVLESDATKRAIEVYYRKNGDSTWINAQDGQSKVYTFDIADMTIVKGLQIETYTGYAAIYNNLKNGVTASDAFKVKVPECEPGDIFSSEFKNIKVSVPTAFTGNTSMSFDNYPEGYLSIDESISYSYNGFFGENPVTIVDDVDIGKVLKLYPSDKPSEYTGSIFDKGTAKLDLGSNIDLTRGETVIDITAKFPKLKFEMIIGNEEGGLGIRTWDSNNDGLRVRAHYKSDNLMSRDEASNNYYTYRFIVSPDFSYRVLVRKYGETGAFTEWGTDKSLEKNRWTTCGLNSFRNVSFIYEIDEKNYNNEWQGWSIKKISVKQKTPFNGSRTWDFSDYTADDAYDLVKIVKNEPGSKYTIENGMLKFTTPEVGQNWNSWFNFDFGEDISFANGPITVEVDAKAGEMKTSLLMIGKKDGEQIVNNAMGIGSQGNKSGWYVRTDRVVRPKYNPEVVSYDTVKDNFLTYTFKISDRTYSSEDGTVVFRPYELWITDAAGTKTKAFESDIATYKQEIVSTTQMDVLSGLQFTMTAGAGLTQEQEYDYAVKRISVSQEAPTTISTGIDSVIIRDNRKDGDDKQYRLVKNLGGAYVATVDNETGEVTQVLSDKANVSVKITNAGNEALSGKVILAVKDVEGRLLNVIDPKDATIPAESSTLIEGFQFDVNKDSKDWTVEAYFWDMTDDQIKPLTNKIER